MYQFFRRVSTKPAKKLLESLLKEENVPVLVCLTHVDRLYVEHIDKDVDNECTPHPTEYKKRVIGHELTVGLYRTVTLYMLTVIVMTTCHTICMY